MDPSLRNGAVRERLLRNPDFDYLALVHDRYEPPPWPAIHPVRVPGAAELCADEGVIVCRLGARP